MNGALPNRENVVVTRDTSFEAPNCKVMHSIDEIKSLTDSEPNKEWFIIGGEEIFQQVLPFTDRIYMTYIDHEFEGDTFFP